MTDNSDLIAERDRLQAEIACLRVGREKDIPPDLLLNAGATTEDQARALADSLLEWKGSTTSATPTSPAPFHSVSQVSREALRHLSPEQVTAVYRQGGLECVGAPAPPPRRTGESRPNAAP